MQQHEIIKVANLFKSGSPSDAALMSVVVKLGREHAFLVALLIDY
jgi:hypothetical protein